MLDVTNSKFTDVGYSTVYCAYVKFSTSVFLSKPLQYIKRITKLSTNTYDYHRETEMDTVVSSVSS